MERVLIAYATKHGATAEIAEKIGQVMRAEDLEVEVLPVAQVRGLEGYGAVVVGSCVYAGRWPREAARFLRAHEAVLRTRPTWFFSSGPTGRGDPAKLLRGWTFPANLRGLARRIQPRGIVVFHGVLDPGRLSPLERLVIKLVRAPLGDFRDWYAISGWAASVASTLKEEAGGP